MEKFLEVKFLPVFFERLKRIVPEETFDPIVKTFYTKPAMSFRFQGAGESPAHHPRELEDAGFHLEKINWLHNAFILKNKSIRELQETELFKKGKIYIQNLSSMIPVAVLDPLPGETVLDMTAAPGSKTTQMADRMRSQGRLVANDNSRARFFKLKALLEFYGVHNVELSLKPGEIFGKSNGGTFDKILLDAPCSTEGRFSAEDPKTFRYWKIQKVKEMARKQKGLIMSAIHALKPGGTLVYSTCTFAPEENEAVLDAAIKKFGELIDIEPIELPITNKQSGITEWEGKAFNPRVRNALRILPDGVMEGFFAAKIKKSRTSSR